MLRSSSLERTPKKLETSFDVFFHPDRTSKTKQNLSMSLPDGWAPSTIPCVLKKKLDKVFMKHSVCALLHSIYQSSAWTLQSLQFSINVLYASALCSFVLINPKGNITASHVPVLQSGKSHAHVLGKLCLDSYKSTPCALFLSFSTTIYKFLKADF